MLLGLQLQIQNYILSKMVASQFILCISKAVIEEENAPFSFRKKSVLHMLLIFKSSENNYFKFTSIQKHKKYKILYLLKLQIII